MPNCGDHLAHTYRTTFKNSQMPTIALLWQKPAAVLIEDFLGKYSD